MNLLLESAPGGDLVGLALVRVEVGAEEEALVADETLVRLTPLLLAVAVL